jgi:hypothetical protein
MYSSTLSAQGYSVFRNFGADVASQAGLSKIESSPVRILDIT